MDGLSKLVINGDPAALNMVKSVLTTPTLINTDILQGMPYAIPLDCKSYRQTGSAAVSESLLIVRNGKKNIADNVAPGAWSWEMSGYIPGSKLLEQTNYYTPIVMLNTDILKLWFKRGAVLVFKDMSARIHKRVVIQNLSIDHEPDCANAAPFSMTLKEINMIEDEGKDEGILSKITEGSSLGTALKAGVTVTGTVLNAVNVLSA